MRTFLGNALRDDSQTQLDAASTFPWRDIRITHWVFLESDIRVEQHGRSSDEATSTDITDKTLQDQPRLERHDRSICEGA